MMNARTVLVGVGALIGVFIAAPFYSGATEAQQARPAVLAASLCTAAEQVLFRCRIGVRIASVCVSNSGKSAQYRFGRPNAVELAYPNGLRGVITWARTGYSGGGEVQLSFLNGQHRYILYSKTVRTSFVDGANDPRHAAGVAVTRGSTLISHRRCSDTRDPFFADPEGLLAKGEFAHVQELAN